MRIRLAICDADKTYISRVVGVFNSKFNDKLEIYSFTSDIAMMSYINSNKIDVILSSEHFAIDTDLLPEQTVFAYLTESSSIDSYKGQKTIGKFQKADIIYKEILALYSEVSVDRRMFRQADDGSTNVVSFFPCSGGVGSSTMATACSYNLVAKGKKVLYLNLEQFGASKLLFTGDGTFTLSDIIFTIKSKNANLAMKLESSVKQDSSGVYFYDACVTPLDLFELSGEEMERLINELKNSGGYDYIIIDSDFHLNNILINTLMNSDTILFVSSGSSVSNVKYRSIYDTLQIIDRKYNMSLLSKMATIYNKYSDTTSQQIEFPTSVRILGGVPEFNKNAPKDLAKHISYMAIFDSL